MTARASSARSLLLFGVTQLVLVAVVAFVLRAVFPLAGDSRAIAAAAALALVVQSLTFLLLRSFPQEQVIAAWGLGVVLRFAVVALWGFVLVPALGLAATPALIALVSFFFVSTVVEPLFLNS